MKLSFRRPVEPPPGPSQDQIIANLSHELARVRAELANANNIVVYQNGRMRDMAGQILGSQATVGRFLAATETLLLDRGVILPDPVSKQGHPRDVVPHECRHATTKHGQWGCWAPGCDCATPRSTLDKAKAAAS